MANAAAFGAKLTLVLKALSISRGRLAAEIGVDKSVVGRWASGAVQPSPCNLERLTHAIACRSPGFTALDWDRGIDSLAERFGVSLAIEAPAPDICGFFPEAMLAEGRANILSRGQDFAGLWRTTRPQVGLGTQLVHDHILQWVAPDGLLRHVYGVAGQLRFEGWALPIHDQVYAITADAASGVLIFNILHGVPRRKPMVMEGLSLTCMRGRDSLISAAPCLFERIADLSGDAEVDEARFAQALAGPALASEGSIAPEICARLLPDLGPASVAAGGRLMMAVGLSTSLASVAPLGSDFWSSTVE